MRISNTPGWTVWSQPSMVTMLLRGSSLSRKQRLTIYICIVIHQIRLNGTSNFCWAWVVPALSWRLKALRPASVLLRSSSYRMNGWLFSVLCHWLVLREVLPKGSSKPGRGVLEWVRAWILWEGKRCGFISKSFKYLNSQFYKHLRIFIQFHLPKEKETHEICS